jgi:hypothetical protein
MVHRFGDWAEGKYALTITRNRYVRKFHVESGVWRSSLARSLQRKWIYSVLNETCRNRNSRMGYNLSLIGVKKVRWDTSATASAYFLQTKLYKK